MSQTKQKEIFMKKIFLSCLGLASILTLGGCSMSSDADAITSLNNQLSSVQSVVSSTSVEEVSDVSPSVTLASDEPYNSIQSLRALSNEKMLREEEIRQKILTLNSTLKSCTNQKYKLGKKKTNALKDISNNLSKYSSHLSETKARVKNSVKQIKRNLKVSNINIEEATSGYITLSNSMNERYAYLSNIYDNLEQASIILDCYCTNCEHEEYSQHEQEPEINITQGTMPSNRFNEDYLIQENNNEENSSSKFTKNIDSYRASNEQSSTADTVYPQTPEQVNPQPVPRPYPAGGAYQTPPYNNGYYSNGYGYYGNGRINPNRNTDTFYSFNRNIDTYRYNPNYYNNYGY